jgi:hypothetical protein
MTMMTMMTMMMMATVNYDEDDLLLVCLAFVASFHRLPRLAGLELFLLKIFPPLCLIHLLQINLFFLLFHFDLSSGTL